MSRTILMETKPDFRAKSIFGLLKIELLLPPDLLTVLDSKYALLAVGTIFDKPVE